MFEIDPTVGTSLSTPPQASDGNPCVTCGACCAYFRASFYWAEADDSVGGTVPIGMTERLDLHLRVMKGTNQPNPRCIALEGVIGSCVKCSIYELRSSACREFRYSWQDGLHNERCDQARAAKGLQPLEPPMLLASEVVREPGQCDTRMNRV
jgi:hypothetical protein